MSIEKLPRVIVALDTDVDHAQSVLTRIENYERSQVGVEIRDSLLRVCGNQLITMSRELGLFVIANSKIADTSAKQIIDINNWQATENPITKEKIPKPDAITMVPPITDYDSAHLSKTIEEAGKNGLQIIGSPAVYSYHQSDIDLFAWQSVVAEKPALLAGFNALEVIYGGLALFAEQRPGGIDQIIVSKITPYEPDIRAAAEHVFEYGGTSLLLGDTILAAEDPRIPIDAILTVAEKAF